MYILTIRSIWDIAIITYIFIAIISLFFTLLAILGKVQLNSDGNGYDKSLYFDEQNIEL